MDEEYVHRSATFEGGVSWQFVVAVWSASRGPPAMVETPTLTREEWVRWNAIEPILDLGCADSVYFDHGIDFVGLDIDEASPDIVGEIPDRFIKGDATRAPIRSKSFRTVILAEILEHLPNPSEAIQEARRIATERILVTVPDEARWQPAAKPGEHDDHVRIYTNSQLSQHLQKGGVSDGQMEIGHITQPPFAFWVALVEL